jgi:hypothetical protein
MNDSWKWKGGTETRGMCTPQVPISPSMDVQTPLVYMSLLSRWQEVEEDRPVCAVPIDARVNVLLVL